jgi:hypothetical protein
LISGEYKNGDITVGLASRGDPEKNVHDFIVTMEETKTCDIACDFLHGTFKDAIDAKTYLRAKYNVHTRDDIRNVVEAVRKHKCNLMTALTSASINIDALFSSGRNGAWNRRS